VRIAEWRAGVTCVPILEELARHGFDRWVVVEPVDHLLERRIRRAAGRVGARVQWLDTPMFLSSKDWNMSWLGERSRPRMADYYIAQRQRLGVLLEEGGGRPVGGRWSFDTMNRRRLPRGLEPPPPPAFSWTAPDLVEAAAWADATFPGHPGSARDAWLPVDSDGARAWLEEFLARRLARFGDYQDAISSRHDVLFHSALSPLINAGLLTPRETLDWVLEAAREFRVPLNSAEGFLRQLIGWREFVRAIYERDGVAVRNANHWGHAGRLSAAWDGARTGLSPLDAALERVDRRGWCHHIERLMVIGNAMLLAGVAPNEAYRWFMERFLDAYDWVMVPNVYGMSQYADGGGFATKPYIAGSNYLRKMSDFEAGPWTEEWDGLFWTFVGRWGARLRREPRLAVLALQWTRMPASRRRALERAADAARSRLLA